MSGIAFIDHFPPKFDASGLLYRTDQRKLYINSGTFDTPAFEDLAAGSAALLYGDASDGSDTNPTLASGIFKNYQNLTISSPVTWGVGGNGPIVIKVKGVLDLTSTLTLTTVQDTLFGAFGAGADVRADGGNGGNSALPRGPVIITANEITGTGTINFTGINGSNGGAGGGSGGPQSPGGSGGVGSSLIGLGARALPPPTGGVGGDGGSGPGQGIGGAGGAGKNTQLTNEIILGGGVYTALSRGSGGGEGADGGDRAGGGGGGAGTGVFSKGAPGGMGGTGGTGAAGGGAGGAGGQCYLCIICSLTSAININVTGGVGGVGGNSGAPSSCGGGGGGGGGNADVLFVGPSPHSAVITVTGGAGGNGGEAPNSPGTAGVGGAGGVNAAGAGGTGSGSAGRGGTGGGSKKMELDIDFFNIGNV